jgi:hypothetical protein
MATAIFNTNIETPSGTRLKSYNLDTVITKYGFEVDSFEYDLMGKTTGVSLVGNALSVSANSYGTISITIKGGQLMASASTSLYGFYATKAEIINNANTVKNFQNGRLSAQTIWSKLVGGNQKAGA